MSCHKRMLLLHEPGSRYTLAKADRCSYRKPKHLVGKGADLARIFGVSDATIDNWKAQHPDRRSGRRCAGDPNGTVTFR